jgi:ATP-dependent Clp protease ATP-binding subunit ClpA
VAEPDQIANFTLRTPKVFQLAYQEAHRLHHDCVSVEHLLLALVKENFGLAARVLQNSNCSLLSGRQFVARAIPAIPGFCAIGKLPWTIDVYRAMERAEEANRLLHLDVGTGHVLLALLSEWPTLIARVFGDDAPDPSVVSVQVLEALTATNWTEVEDYSRDAPDDCFPELLLPW